MAVSTTATGLKIVSMESANAQSDLARDPTIADASRPIQIGKFQAWLPAAAKYRMRPSDAMMVTVSGAAMLI